MKDDRIQEDPQLSNQLPDSMDSTGAGDEADGRWTLPPGAVGRLAGELFSLAVIVFLTFAARSAFGDHYWVPSGSMENTLLPGDRVLVDKTAYGLRVPFTSIELLDGSRVQPGDVVVFDSPETGDRLIKRAVAIAGDRVDLHDGHLRVDGEPLADPFDPAIEVFDQHRAELNLEHGGGPDIRGITVPDDMVLVLGDHRGNSRDGRAFGLIPEDLIYARALVVYWRTAEGLTWKVL